MLLKTHFRPCWAATGAALAARYAAAAAAAATRFCSSWRLRAGYVGVDQARPGDREEPGLRVREAVFAPRGASCKGGHAGIT